MKRAAAANENTKSFGSTTDHKEVNSNLNPNPNGEADPNPNPTRSHLAVVEAAAEQ